jgi:hypothetical protein
MNIIVVGPAGSGKTALVGALADWIAKNVEWSAVRINLDPGVDFLPYEPDFDIRSMFTVKGIMEKERLGPNGALMRAMELMAERRDEIFSKISSLKADFRLIDSPGQLEAFIFHKAAELVKRFEVMTVSLFLIPAELATPLGIATTQFLSIATALRLERPLLNVLSKIDLMSETQMQRVDRLITEPEELKAAIAAVPVGVERDLTIGAAELSARITKIGKLPKVSAKTGAGMEDLYKISYELLCTCGELPYG